MNKKMYFYHSPPLKGERRCTIAGIQEGNTLRIGIAQCSTLDSFVKAKGRKVAIERAENAESGSITFGRSINIGAAFRSVATGLAISYLSKEVKLTYTKK